MGLTALAGACETISPYEPAPDGAPPVAAAERPGFAVGDEFWFSTVGGAIFVEAYTGMEDGLHVFRRDLDYETFYYSPDLALVRVLRPFGSDRYFDPHDGLLEFPLRVGRRWTRHFQTWTSDGPRRAERTRTCEVVDAGYATVPAGRFPALRIECTLQELGRGGIEREELLYAPEVGRIVAHWSFDAGTDVRLIEFSRAE